MTLFLLGAGFNIDAALESGQSGCAYPLVADVLKLCFDRDELPEGKSVEDLFADALGGDDYEPLEKLAERLMEADYYSAQKLASSAAPNAYRRFFEKFKDAHFLTFNYDSLPEIFLSQMERWHPEDGYGLPVATERQLGDQPAMHVNSASLVLHLHGTLCVYTTEFEIMGNPFGSGAELVRRDRPQYAFDPDSITSCFPNYRRMMSNTGLVDIEERVIAPVPDKSEGLKRAFVGETYTKAEALLSEVGTLVAVGYSFNVHDRVSYGAILQALAESRDRSLFIVSPHADDLARKITAEYPCLRVKPIQKTFKQWAADLFRTGDL